MRDGRNKAFQNLLLVEPIASQNESLFRSARHSARMVETVWI